MMDDILIILNFLLYAWVLYKYYKLFPEINAGYVVLISWTAIAAFALLYYHCEDFYTGYKNDLTLLPFLIEFILFLIAFNPFKKIEWNSNIKFVGNPLYMPIIYFTIIAVIPPFIECVLHLFSAEATLTNTMEQYQMRESEEDDLIYFTKITEKFFHQASNMRLVAPVLLFSYLMKNKTNKFVVCGLTMASFFMALFGLSTGNRGPVVNTSLYILFVYLIFRPSLKSSIREKVKKVGLMIAAGTTIYLVLMTIIRFLFINEISRSDTSIIDWIAKYIGEPMINMNRDSFWQKNYLWGELTFPQLYSFFADGVLHDRWDLASKCGLRTHVFYTTFGQLFLEFPVVMVFLLTMLFSVIMNAVRKRIFVNMGNLLIWLAFAYILLDGIFICTIQNSFTTLLYTIILGLLFKILSSNDKINNKTLSNSGL